jgi:hypothetical protein
MNENDEVDVILGGRYQLIIIVIDKYYLQNGMEYLYYLTIPTYFSKWNNKKVLYLAYCLNQF